jgi:prolycopene isomerase
LPNKQKTPFQVVILNTAITLQKYSVIVVHEYNSPKYRPRYYADLVLEQHDRAGGYAHGFKRKKYTFDAGVHLTSGCGMQGFAGGQIIRKVLQAVESYEQLEFVKVNPFAVVSVGGLSVELPTSINALVEQLGDLFPHERQGLQDLLRLCLQLAEQVAKADDVIASNDLAKMNLELNLLLKYRRSTLADIWGSYIREPQLQSTLNCHQPK